MKNKKSLGLGKRFYKLFYNRNVSLFLLGKPLATWLMLLYLKGFINKRTLVEGFGVLIEYAITEDITKSTRHEGKKANWKRGVIMGDMIMPVLKTLLADLNIYNRKFKNIRELMEYFDRDSFSYEDEMEEGLKVIWDIIKSSESDSCLVADSLYFVDTSEKVPVCRKLEFELVNEDAFSKANGEPILYGVSRLYFARFERKILLRSDDMDTYFRFYPDNSVLEAVYDRVLVKGEDTEVSIVPQKGLKKKCQFMIGSFEFDKDGNLRTEKKPLEHGFFYPKKEYIYLPKDINDEASLKGGDVSYSMKTMTLVINILDKDILFSQTELIERAFGAEPGSTRLFCEGREVFVKDETES